MLAILVVLSVVSPPAHAIPGILPILDGGGTLRVDGGAPVAPDGLITQLYSGVSSTRRDATGLDKHGGVLAVVRPWSQLEVGFGVSSFRQLSWDSQGPKVIPGHLLLQARTTQLGRADGLVVSSIWAIPLRKLPNCQLPIRTEWRVGANRSFGPLRVMANGATAIGASGRVAAWGALALLYRLPLGIVAGVDVVGPVQRGWATGASFTVPLGWGMRTTLDLERFVNPEQGLHVQAMLRLTVFTASVGPGLPYHLDLDLDGVGNDIDGCPEEWAPNGTGCPTGTFGRRALRAAVTNPDDGVSTSDEEGDR